MLKCRISPLYVLVCGLIIFFLHGCSGDTITPVTDTNASNNAATTSGPDGGSGNDDGPANNPPEVITTTALEDASRFLNRATFGPSRSAIDEFLSLGVSRWFVQELEKPATFHLTRVLQDFGTDGLTGLERRDLFSQSVWEAMITSDDQLRQRMAFALSQIIVISYTSTSPVFTRSDAMAYYADILTRNAFGNYRDILEEITYSPAMSEYLTYIRNLPADPATFRVPDENYAREIMQLFTIGLLELNQDGTPVLDANGNPIETYDVQDVQGLARVFTGLDYVGRRAASLTTPLIIEPENHSQLEKVFLNTVIPANTSGEESIDIAIDALFNHSNTPPFIARQLIQRFTTSNPTPEYVFVVAEAFRTGIFRLPDGTLVGTGARGDLAATLAAVLTTSFIQDAPDESGADFGKLREPVLRFTHWARAFNINSADSKGFDLLFETGSSDRLSQHPYRADSVFNFYRSTFVPGGSRAAAAGLTAPEFGLVDDASIIGYNNFMTSMITSDFDFPGFRPDYSQELNLAIDPAALVDHLDLVLTYGSLDAITRSEMIAVINSIPVDDPGNEQALRERVETALIQFFSSPSYLVLR